MSDWNKGLLEERDRLAKEYGGHIADNFYSLVKAGHDAAVARFAPLIDAINCVQVFFHPEDHDANNRNLQELFKMKDKLMGVKE